MLFPNIAFETVPLSYYYTMEDHMYYYNYYYIVYYYYYIMEDANILPSTEQDKNR